MTSATNHRLAMQELRAQEKAARKAERERQKRVARDEAAERRRAARSGFANVANPRRSTLMTVLCSIFAIYCLFPFVYLLINATKSQADFTGTFGLWFGAYAETLVDDMRLIAAAWHIANQNPLGSAAGYGSSFPLDRTMTTRLRGFEELHYNVGAAQMSRGKSERAAAAAIAAVAATIGRLAMDVCLFMSQNFGFVSLPDELTPGSSIMPHKKNPDVFEIMRGRCNRLQSVPNEIALLTTNLPVGYHRDLQLLKDILFPATTEIKRTLAMCDFMLAHIRVNEHILDDKKYDYLFTVEDVNRMVLAGTPFREAYKQVGMAVQRGEYTPTREVRHTHEGSIGNLCTAQIRRKMERVMQEFE